MHSDRRGLGISVVVRSKFPCMASVRSREQPTQIAAPAESMLSKTVWAEDELQVPDLADLFMEACPIFRVECITPWLQMSLSELSHCKAFR